MAGFIQIIKFSTSRIDEVTALRDELLPQDGSTVVRAVICADRDKENTYVNIVEFESYESAMENSNRPETTEFAAKMAELCDGPATFHNLDVQEVWPESSS